MATICMDDKDLERLTAESAGADAVLIAGPTASGKSGLAVRLAQALGGEVVNADSMQVYRDLRVLTARPEAELTEAVPHHLFGHVDGAVAHSVGRWLEEIGPVLADIRARQGVAVIVGGTGLYIKALCGGLAPVPAVDAEIRDHWRGRLQAEGAQELHRVLAGRDPAAAAALEATDGQRILRALEVAEATGRSLLWWQKQVGPAGPMEGKRVVRLLLEGDRALIRRRIADRFDAMIAEGAVEEVRSLLARRLPRHLPVMKAIGVAQLADAIAGRLSLEAAVARAKIDSGRYAKRQDTFFRNQLSGPEWRRIHVNARAGR